ncbi:uncharacterized protein BDZ99DRAFT_499546 [Mytilinidion resinicola]|uniref:Uncharacterized protein n=1 Tax=Mytilinidion resinicola TaxID=574789 RepID=A0A6A6YHD4_9PEZI|nr:uncharacterized protein BDZ99DRAFT_499546 [Mytilinidion resinicola]KAF2808170.1 hypothetical protein BDZ99DRAFT_499546 [Mytilinidion resinicola]
MAQPRLFQYAAENMFRDLIQEKAHKYGYGRSTSELNAFLQLLTRENFTDFMGVSNKYYPITASEMFQHVYGVSVERCHQIMYGNSEDGDSKDNDSREEGSEPEGPDYGNNPDQDPLAGNYYIVVNTDFSSSYPPSQSGSRLGLETMSMQRDPFWWEPEEVVFYVQIREELRMLEEALRDSGLLEATQKIGMILKDGEVERLFTGREGVGRYWQPAVQFR